MAFILPRSWFNREQIIKILISLSSIAAFIAAWHAYSVYSNTPYIPGPTNVFGALVNSFFVPDFSKKLMAEHIAASLARVFYALALSILIAVPVGIAMGWSRYFNYAASPIIEMLRSIPPLAWIPFAIVATKGFGAVFIVMLGTTFPIILSTFAGVRAADKTLVDAAKTLGAGNFDVFKKVVLPSTAPHIMTGIRISIGIGWMCIVAAELTGVEGGTGLGVYIQNMSSVFLYEYMFAGMIMIGILGFAMYVLARFIERRVAKWAGMS